MVTRKDDDTGGNDGLLGRRSVLALAGTTAVAGVLGTGFAGADDSLSETLVLDATDRSDVCAYSVTVSEELSVVPTVSNVVEETTETSVEGEVQDGYVALRYDGDVETLTIDGGTDVLFGDAAEAAFPEPVHELEITGPDEVTYEVTTSGPISVDGEGGEVTENDDGTYTARGVASDWATHSYVFEGELEGFSPGLSDYVLYVDGETVLPRDLSYAERPETREIGVRAPDGVDDFEFSLTATGQMARVRDGSDMQAQFNEDRIRENDDGTLTVTAVTGTGAGDTFEVAGEVTEFSASDGGFSVYVDGEEVSPASLTGVDPDEAREFEITGPDEVSYELTTSGPIEAQDDGGEVVMNPDGSYTARGVASDWANHRYLFEGEIESFSPVLSDYVLYLDGDVVSPTEITDAERPETQRIGVRSPLEDGMTVTFTATGEVARVRDGSHMQAEFTNDHIYENEDGTYTVEAFMGNGYGDSFHVAGDVIEIDPMEGEYTLYVDEEEISPYDLLGEEPPEAVIGGGVGYDRTLTEDDATMVVDSRWSLQQALTEATAGDVVFVDGDAAIYAGTATFTVPEGVTLASDRGVNGSDGGLVYTDQLHDDHYGMLRVRGDARVTGLRVRGPIDPEGWTEHSYDHEITGIYVQDDGVEIDNVDVAGWGYANVYTADDTHVHHSELHHANVEGLGYAVMANNSAHPIVEYNEFYHNRHAICGSGGGGFTARYNVVRGPSISHVFDQHRPGGTTTKIYNNTVEVVENEQRDKLVPAVGIRGVPDETADVYNNWFHNPKEPRSTPNDWTDEAIIQVHTDSWRSVHFWSNQYGSDEPASNVGAPR